MKIENESRKHHRNAASSIDAEEIYWEATYQVNGTTKSQICGKLRS